MIEFKENKILRYLIGYYGILQTIHLFFLGRAGIILELTGRVPFPASPPLGGWGEEVIPFLMGMAGADVIAACLGIYFSFSLLIKSRLKLLVEVISLTIALSSAVVYLIGTSPTGAWVQNPISYLIVIFAFSPIIPLYFLLIRAIPGKMEPIL